MLHLIVVAGLMSNAVAQDTTVISSRKTCHKCVIRFERVATLGGVSDSVSYDHVDQVFLDSRGRIYAVPWFRRGEVHRYDPAGKWIGTFGRPGRGPGELSQLLRLAFGPADSLHVFEPLVLEHSVFNPALTYSTVFRLPAFVDQTVALPNRMFAMTPMMEAPRAAEGPVYLYRDGTLLRSIGQKPVKGSLLNRVRSIAAGKNGTLWIASRLKYEIEQWDTAGHLIRVLRRERKSFPNNEGQPIPDARTDRPLPALTGVWEDASGLLWVLMSYANGWKPLKGPQVGEGPRVTVALRNEWYDAVIEVIDPRTGLLLASARYPLIVRRLNQPGYVSTIRAAPDGDNLVDVWRTRLLQPTK